MKILIKGARVIDPANKVDEIADVLIENAKISKVGKNLKTEAQEIIEASGKIVMPGIVDMHVHCREPGREDKETITTATAAALKGGVTSILAMPNTDPAMDSADNIKFLKDIIAHSASVNVLIAAAITKDRRGDELTDIAKLKQEGAIAITDDGSSVDSDDLMHKALKEAQKNKILVICHCEDKKISNSGVVNLGFISTRMGLRGISKESEYKRVARDIALAEKTKCPLHIAHVSCKESVDIIGQAKKKGVKVTAETAPHYFSLCEHDCLGYDTNMKMNPPLRTRGDVAAIKQALKDGVIDAIASDHAPHTENEKEIEFDRAEFGIIGLETELAVSIAELIHTKVLSWPQLVEKLTVNPAKILNINKGALSVGCDADLIIVDPDKEWVLVKESIVSKSKNSPFINRKFKGSIDYTIRAGKIVYQSNTRV